MENGSYVVNGLHRKRAEIAGRLAAAQAEAAHLAKSLEALEATIRLFSPDAELPALRASPTAPPHRLAKHGEVPRFALDVLREAAEPMAMREVAIGVMAACGFAGTDVLLVRAVHKRVGSALREMERRGVLRSETRDDGLPRWSVA